MIFTNDEWPEVNELRDCDVEIYWKQLLYDDNG